MTVKLSKKKVVKVKERGEKCMREEILRNVGTYCLITRRHIFFPVTLRPNAGHGLPILEVSRSHTTTHHSR